MADYKILKQNAKGDEVDVIFYIPVADSSLHPKILEDAGSGDGSIYEYQKTIKFSANLSKNEKQNIIESKFSGYVTLINTKLNKIFEFYGYEGNI